MPTPEQRRMFRRALVRAREARGPTQRDLAASLGVTPGAVAQWELGDTTPRPTLLSPLESLLELEDGTLRRLVTHEPITASDEACDVLHALDADPQLNDRQRDLLAGMYREIVGDTDPPTES